MPTPASAAAFAKLVEKRTRLNEVSKLLHEALGNRFSVQGEQRYRELQAEWDLALSELESATAEFQTIIHHLHDEPEAPV